MGDLSADELLAYLQAEFNTPIAAVEPTSVAPAARVSRASPAEIERKLAEEVARVASKAVLSAKAREQEEKALSAASLPRPVPGEPDFYINPATGKKVRRSGRIGKTIERNAIRSLEEAGTALLRGTIRGSRALPIASTGDEQLGSEKKCPPELAATAAGEERWCAYHRRRFVVTATERVTTASFALTIAAAARTVPNYRHAIISFITHSEEGDPRIYRTIHGIENGKISPVKMIKEIERVMHRHITDNGAEGYISDAVPAYYEPVIDEFYIGYIEMSYAGALKGTVCKGRVHPHFKLSDLSTKAAKGDCFLATLRGCAASYNLEKPKGYNKTIREKLNIPAGDIEMSDKSVAPLAELFGLHVRVITGMQVPPDSERVYNDDIFSLEAPNRCTTVPTPIVIAEGGAATSPVCDVYYSDGHCELITGYKPVDTCPITGDIIVSRRTTAEIKSRVLQQGRCWHAPESKTAVKKGLKKEIKYVNKVIVFDYETVYGANGSLEPYALGYIVLTGDDIKGSHDFTARAEDVHIRLRRPGESAQKVTEPLLELLKHWNSDSDTQVRYTLVSFNGARFDHFILAKAANEAGCLGSIFATASGGIRSIRIRQHTTLDLAKLMPGMSLAKCCDEFKTLPTKLAGFSHKEPQDAKFEGRLYEWLDEKCAELVSYLERDVLSTASLLVLARNAMLAITKMDILAAKTPQTIGGIAWRLMQSQCDLPSAVANEETDSWIRSALTGGRVQVYSSRQNEPIKITGEPLRMGDFVSLYPTTMAAVDKCKALFPAEWQWGCYPSVAESEPEQTTEWRTGDVGIYEVTIHSQPEGKPNVLPKRTEGEPLDWHYRGEFTTKATHIDLALIKSGGGSFTVHRGLRWRSSVRGLFSRFILPLAALKNEQDVFDSAGDQRYNAALRQVIKLLMNAASGKTCQKNYDDICELATGSAAMLAAERRMDQTALTSWIPLGPETVLICGKRPAQKVYKPTVAKPAALAVFIYAYSRALVWRTLCQHNILYSDTDSGLFRLADWERLCAEFPDLIPVNRRKELGDLEQEIGENTTANCYLKAAKDYAVFPVGKDSKGKALKPKVRVKGLHMDTDRLVNPGHRICIDGMSMRDLAAEYEGCGVPHENGERCTIQIKGNEEEFFDIRLETKVDVLCSQITRTFKDSRCPFELRQRFLVKEV